MFQTAFFRAHESIFGLIAPNSRQPQLFASAFCIEFGGERHFISAAHAIHRFDPVSLIRTLGGRAEFPFEVDRIDDTVDLALLRCRSHEAPLGRALQFASGSAQYGMSACAIGYPLTIRCGGMPPMLNLRIAGCIVASDMDLSGAVPPHDIPIKDAFEVDANLHGGFSGAPVLDITGGVIGCVSHAFVRPTVNASEPDAPEEVDFTVCIGLGTLRRFLGAA